MFAGPLGADLTVAPCVDTGTPTVCSSDVVNWASRKMAILREPEKGAGTVSGRVNSGWIPEHLSIRGRSAELSRRHAGAQQATRRTWRTRPKFGALEAHSTRPPAARATSSCRTPASSTRRGRGPNPPAHTHLRPCDPAAAAHPAPRRPADHLLPRVAQEEGLLPHVRAVGAHAEARGH